MFDAGAFGTILWSGNNELGYTIIGSTHGNYTLSTIGGNTIEYHGLSITAGQTTPFDIKEDIVALNENSMTSNYTGTTVDNPLEILTISSTYIRDTTYTLSDYSGLLP